MLCSTIKKYYLMSVSTDNSIINNDRQPFVPPLRAEQKILILILAVGAVLRFWHIGWGLPDLYEEATPLVKSWKMWHWGAVGFDFNPHFFNYPALMFYVNFLIQLIQFVFGYLLGIYPSVNSFGSTLTTLVLPSRLLISLFDIGTIYITYSLAKRMGGESVGLIASAFVAVNPLLIEQAHYITVDTPLAFFVMLSLLCIHGTVGSSERKRYLAAGVSIGLAAATKYTGALLLPVLVIIHMLNSGSMARAFQTLSNPKLWLAAASAAGVFFLSNPFIILSNDEFVRDFSFEQYHVSYGHLGLDPSQSTLQYYILEVMARNFGWPLFLLLVGTLLMFVVRKERNNLMMMTFPLLYFVIISSWQMRAPRYSLPMFPLFLIVTAIGATQLWQASAAFFSRWAAGHQSIAHQVTVGTTIALGVILLAQPLALDYDFQRSISAPDTRTLVKGWIASHVPPGSTIATGPFGIALPDTLYRVLFIPFLAQEPERITAFYDTRWYEDCDLLIASDFDYGRYRMEPKRYADFLPYYDTLKTRWTLILELKPEAYQQGPTIWLYTSSNIPKKKLFDSSLFAKLEIVPESLKVSNFLRELSIVLIEKGRLDKAEQVLKNLVSVETTNLAARFTLARVLFTIGKYEDALHQAQRIVFADQTKPEVYVFAGDALLRLGRGREAEYCFLQALQLNNSYEPAYEDLIAYYTDAKEKNKVLETLKRYYSILPQGSERAEAVAEKIRLLRNPS